LKFFAGILAHESAAFKVTKSRGQSAPPETALHFKYRQVYSGTLIFSEKFIRILSRRDAKLAEDAE